MEPYILNFFIYIEILYNIASMKKIVIKYKLIDHTTRQCTAFIFCVYIPHNTVVTHDIVKKVHLLVKEKATPLLVGFSLLCEKHEGSGKCVMIDGILTQVEAMKKVTCVYDKGVRPTDPMEKYKYNWVHGQRGEYIYDGILKQKPYDPATVLQLGGRHGR